ncbi:MAG: NAD(P)-dependent glycerol-3-phosphate dehydrogenase [Rhodobacteraceae bacterium]|jgi:glycerol-3-phosphate dehydrogenase (NAD(P)+)|nr:NAD(P)-dependent glycerol-3-phosphate dehydrogenase [Paracoccaceae bacterium]
MAGGDIAVLGAGAFGTALAIVLAEAGRAVTLWGRDVDAMAELAAMRENRRHLPGARLPAALAVTADPALVRAATILLAVPTQGLRGLLAGQPELAGRRLVACCKGVERGTGLLPTEVIADVLPGTPTAVLTGPSFAADIAAGKPTALTLATATPGGETLQALLSTPALRLYLGPDPLGAQLGGALKNVVAIAAGIAIGAGLGDSARAALMTRGFAEMGRFAAARGGRAETLFGLSGFGDLVLTCTSAQSRNLRHGLAIGGGQPVDRAVTVEGVMTAHAVVETAGTLDLPVTRTVSAILNGELSVPEATEALMSRPLKREDGD